MVPDQTLRSEVSNYLILGERLKEHYTGLDKETARDTLEGLSDLPELIGAVIRSSLDDEATVIGIKSRLDDLQARLSRVKERYEKKRALACWAMAEANLPKVVAPDFSVSLRASGEKLEVIDETRVPSEYFVPQPPRLDRRSLTEALKRGTMVNGALLVMAEPTIGVRVR
ncbi:MAG: siphovirus Gp157 family protein [Alphaproteobacteria bacterium]|nr:siphovirus Gp157 family protein [Alphaproteobacteria bacterium]MBL7097209.1 siphovirus Gp157 family protein [Alphaproteobacteria bacterium]